jgi:hypothetical protein
MRPPAVVPGALWLMSVAGGGLARAEVDADLDRPAEIRWSGRAELGPEFDTNPARLERVDGVDAAAVGGSPAGRAVVAGELARLSGRHVAVASLSLAGKGFARQAARGEDVLVVQGSLGWGAAVAASTRLSLLGGYYDVFQRGSTPGDRRDFRSLTPAVRVEHLLAGGAALDATAGWRRFTYKPHPDFDFSAPTLTVGYRDGVRPPALGDGREWEWALTASLEDRRFTGPRCLVTDDCPPAGAAPTRRDRFASIAAEVTRTGAALIGGGLAVHGNRSNSFGETIARALIHVRGVFLLPGDLSLSARAEVALTRHRETLPLARNPLSGTPIASVEDESHSTARVEIVRPAGAGLDLGLRYTLYTSALTGGPVSYGRQVALAFVAVSLD